MIHVALLARGAQKTSRQRDTSRLLEQGQRDRKAWFKEQREAGREML